MFNTKLKRELERYKQSLISYRERYEKEKKYTTWLKKNKYISLPKVPIMRKDKYDSQELDCPCCFWNVNKKEHYISNQPASYPPVVFVGNLPKKEWFVCSNPDCFWESEKRKQGIIPQKEIKYNPKLWDDIK